MHIYIYTLGFELICQVSEFSCGLDNKGFIPDGEGILQFCVTLIPCLELVQPLLK
jgi:hypothetical protein